MISQTAEYALRAMVFLSMKRACATGQEIADATKVPSKYLSKIMQQLVKARLVDSRRGIGGGFKLCREPDSISILDVITAVDPFEKIVTCPLGIETHGVNLCPLHHRLAQATASVEEAFQATALSELIVESEPPLCSIPFTESHNR